VSKKRGYTVASEGRSLRGILKATYNAKWALLAPLIILGGIYGGVFTVTEASIVAVLYALFVGFLIYRDLTWGRFIDSLVFMSRVSGSLFIVLVTGMIFGRLLAIFQIPQAVSEFLITNIHSPVLLVLLIDALLLFIGMWMESITQIIILTPLLLPAVVNLGIHPIQFGIMFTIACEIGYETPPLGVNLFVASEIAGTTIERISKEAAILALAEIAALVLVSLIPQISLFLPRLLGYIS
jgi:C4-dicarboxylate transporter DctM subunit